MQRDHDSEMLPSTENSKPSRIPLVIWFVEVIVVIIICCVVIRMSFVPWPPTYALFDPTYIDHDSHTHVSGKTNQNGTIIFLLRIRNPNEGKGIIHGETKINLYKDGFIVGVQTMQGFYQGQTSNFSTQVLVNVDQQILGKAYDQTSGNGTLGVGLETRVRYRILGWTTKQHLLKLEGSVPINEEGSLLLSEDGVQLQPVKEKL